MHQYGERYAVNNLVHAILKISSVNQARASSDLSFNLTVDLKFNSWPILADLNLVQTFISNISSS